MACETENKFFAFMPIPWFQPLFAVFCIYYVIHGLLAERPYEVIVMVLATFAVLIYIIVNYIMSTQNDVKLVSSNLVYK